MSQFPLVDVQELKPTEAINPFALVWQALTVTLLATVILVVTIVIVIQILDVTLPLPAQIGIVIALFTVPSTIWFIAVDRQADKINLGQQRYVSFVMIILLVSAVAIPINFLILRPDQWLSSESTINRIIGYAITIMALQQGFNYLVMRYSAWDEFTQKHLAVVYAVTIGLGSACVYSVAQWLTLQPSLDFLAMRVLLNVTTSVCGALLLSFVLMRLRLNQSAIWTLPVAFGIVCVLTAVAVTFRSGIMSALIGISETDIRPLFSLGFVVGFLGIITFLVSFIFTADERRLAIPGSIAFTPSFFDLNDLDNITFKQRWGNLLVIALMLIMVIGGYFFRERLTNRTTQYLDATTGILINYPLSWLRDTGGNDYIFRVRDMQYIGFKTTIQIAVVPIGQQTTERNVADRLAFERSSTLIDYRQLSVEPFTFRDSLADLVTYTFVSREFSPFLESIPLVVIGTDIIFLNEGQAIILSFRADSTNYDDQYPIFTRFLNALEF